VNPLIQIQKATPSIARGTPACLLWAFTPAHAVVSRAGRRLSQLHYGRRSQSPFQPSPLALETTQLVGSRSLVTPPAASKPLPARDAPFNTADSNTAFGAAALLFNTTGDLNTSRWNGRSFNNIEGTGNVAVGIRGAQNNTTGAFNTAIGGDVLL